LCCPLIAAGVLLLGAFVILARLFSWNDPSAFTWATMENMP